MATDTDDHKHRRSSDEESEEPSKRRKHHRHHRRKHHHRHHSRKHEEDKVDDESAAPATAVDSRLDYDMEEGEIVEEGEVVMVKKMNDSDAESGEIKTETHGDVVVPTRSRKSPLDDANGHLVGDRLTDVDRENGGGLVDSPVKERKDNGYMRVESDKVRGDRKSRYDYDDDYERRDRKHKELVSKHAHERRREDVATTSRSRSHERHRERSRSRSVSHGVSRLETHKEDIEYYTSKNHNRDDYDDRANRPRKYDGQKADSVKADEDSEKIKREEIDEEPYEDRADLQADEDDEEEDLNRIKEESRRRIEAIKEKYKAKSKPQLQDTTKENVEEPSRSVSAAKVNSGTPDGQGEGSDTNTGDTPFSLGRSPPQNGNSGVEKTSGTGGLGEGTPKSEGSNGDAIFGESPARVREKAQIERSNDMFSDDIFEESPAGIRKSGKGDGLTVQRSGLQDNWDDAEGYYSYRFGEVLDGRYEVIAAHGKGVFSTVVRAKDLKAGSGDPEEVAIKIIRNNDKMYKAGLEELVILKKLVGADPEDRRHCVRFLSSFKYRNHLCLVFESLHMNLREVLKKFGRNIGLKLTGVRAYAKQLFIALKHLRNCGVLHTDIKPDNMLVNEAKNVLKLCDFGNAMFAGKNEITPYLVSRFYRAPEIILGLTYDHPVDMWSVGCCLFELYTGKVLFPGATNNDMLRLQMELKGPFPKKMLRKGAFTELHFDQDLNFVSIEEDPVTKKTVKRLVNTKAKDIGSIVMSSPGDDPKMVANFKDLLEKMFLLDPDKRITVQQALGHPFITGK
ncbi:hypothetical protein CTI12_AA046940 [Artemisia annua]|uniref:Serine/threonine-protein kinase PRP4 homolog n=1 Tax=Artemisia annua TaxID=35608 RepID=A0A2U1QB52_ARTAN|nr:hypothetical protein CTI12_AA046940 [Artemisia annua]